MVFVIAVGALLAGCGGSGSGQKADAVYASSVCAALGSWLTEVKSADTVHSLRGVTRASITAKMNHFETATKQFVSQLKAVPRPNGSKGREAINVDRQLISAAQTQSESANTIAATILSNGSMAQVVAALAALPDYRVLKTTTQQTLSLGADGTLAPVFESQKTCNALG